MGNFNKWMEDHATAWRVDHVETDERGVSGRRPRSWVLPRESWEEGLWPGIRRDAANSLDEYVERSQVQKHREYHNLKSSWILCANLYFPFRASGYGRDLLATFLKSHVAGEITSLESVDLEYAESGDLHPSELLGESRGRRGANQTSPDLGLVVNGGRGLILVESKFTEKSFYQCSAWKSKGSRTRPANPNPDRCNNPLEVVNDPANQCHQSDWGRKYWKVLAPVAVRNVMDGLPRCPAAQHGYQLFRQQALAEGIAQSGKYDLVVSAVAFDERNEALSSALRRSGIADLKGWGTLFRGRARFAAFSHQEWVCWVRERDERSQFVDWLNYVQGRYGLGG